MLADMPVNSTTGAATTARGEAATPATVAIPPAATAVIAPVLKADWYIFDISLSCIASCFSIVKLESSYIPSDSVNWISLNFSYALTNFISDVFSTTFLVFPRFCRAVSVFVRTICRLVFSSLYILCALRESLSASSFISFAPMCPRAPIPAAAKPAIINGIGILSLLFLKYICCIAKQKSIEFFYRIIVHFSAQLSCYLICPSDNSVCIA